LVQTFREIYRETPKFIPTVTKGKYSKRTFWGGKDSRMQENKRKVKEKVCERFEKAENLHIKHWMKS